MTICDFFFLNMLGYYYYNVDDCYLFDAFFLKKTNFNLPFIVFNKLAKYQYHVMNTYIWTKTLLSHLRPTRFNVSHIQRLDVQ